MRRTIYATNQYLSNLPVCGWKNPMRHRTLPALCIAVATIVSGFATPAGAETEHLWSYGFGNTEENTCSGVAMDGAGNVVITGYFYDTMDFGGGPLSSGVGYGVFLAKYLPDGTHAWSKRFGGGWTDSGEAWGRSVAVDGSGNIVTAGTFHNPGAGVEFGGDTLSTTGDGMFVAKYDASGNHQWSQGFEFFAFSGPTNDGILAVAVDGSGNVAITGSFFGDVNFGGSTLTSTPGSLDIFVAKFDANGVHQWSQRFGGIHEDKGVAVAFDGSGNVVITGYFGAYFGETVDFGGGPLTGGSAESIFVAKYSAIGVHQWSQSFNQGSSWGKGEGIAVDGSGNVVITGGAHNGADFGGGPVSTGGFIAKFNPSGVHLWSKGGTGSPYAAAVDAAGNIGITGRFSGTVDFGGGPLTSAVPCDIFVARYGPDGMHQWSQRGEATLGCSYGAGIAMGGAGGLAIGGEFTGTADFGGGPLGNPAHWNIFVAKFAENEGLVTGKVYWDVGNDCAFDDGTDFAVASRKISVTPGGITTFTGGTGDYAFALPPGQYTVTQAPVANDPWALRTCQTATSYVVNVTNAGTVSGNDFALEAVAFACEVSVNVVSNGISPLPPPCARPATKPCPGIEHEYLFVVKSKPASTIAIPAGTLLDMTLDPKFTIATVSSTFPVSPVSSSGSNQRTVQLDAELNPGQVCVVSVRATPSTGGPYVTQMTFDDSGLCGGVKTASISELDDCSCDPNDKTVEPAGCGPGGEIVGSTPTLTYKVRFENVGPGTAHNIFIEDVLDSDLDENSITILAASASVSGVQLTPGNMLVIDFDNIELAGTSDPNNNKGYVVFSVDPKPGLSEGTTIENTASITFDSNDPVITNTTLNTIRATPDCGPTAVEPIPLTLALEQNSPNPFNPSTLIPFVIGHPDRVRLKVYDINGRLVRTLVDKHMIPGSYVQEWDGRNVRGIPVASGIYFYQLVAGNQALTRKAVLLK